MKIGKWLIIILLGSCTHDKPVLPTLDTRDAWVGTYQGTKTSTFWTRSQPSVTHTDTFSLVVRKDPDTLGYLYVWNQRVLPDLNGYIKMNDVSGYRLWELQLGNDSLILYTASGGLGGGVYESYKGNRMK